MIKKIESNYDLWKLKKARELLFDVYQYYFGDPNLNHIATRLETVIRKLDLVIGGEASK